MTISLSKQTQGDRTKSYCDEDNGEDKLQQSEEVVTLTTVICITNSLLGCEE